MKPLILSVLVLFASCSQRMVPTYPLPPEVVKPVRAQKPSSEVLFFEVAFIVIGSFFLFTGRSPLDGLPK